MTDKQKDLSIYRLKQAEETIGSAKLCEENHYLKDAINRAYYAAFYAVKAVLAVDRTMKIVSEGKYKKDYKDGKWIYYYDYRTGQISKESTYSDKGKKEDAIIYFSNGQIEYRGKLLNEKYHGKGELYDESGQLIYKGNFKNGDIAN